MEQSEAATRAAEVGRSVVDAAVSEANLANGDGDVTKWRLAKAAVRPTSTGRKLLKGAAREGFRQARDGARHGEQADDGAPPGPTEP